MSPKGWLDRLALTPGGTGITHVLSIFLAIIQAHTNGKSAVRSLRLVWNIRHLADVNWIAPLLNSALATSLPEGLSVKIDVHLTRSHVSDEPDMMRGITELLADHHNSTTAGDTNAPSATPATPAESNEKQAEGSQGSSAGNSTLGSANASREKLEEDNEKKSRFADFPKISGEVARVMSFKSGRAGLKGIMRDEVAKASTSMGVSGEWRRIRSSPYDIVSRQFLASEPR